MGTHHETTPNLTERFEFKDSLKKTLFAMMGAGVLGLLLVFFLYPENNHARMWSNLLTNAYYFSGIALIGLFAVSAAQLAYGGWNTLVKRIFISMSSFVMVGGFMLLFILVAGLMGWHNLYDHVKHVLHDPTNQRFTNKLLFYNYGFWIARVAVYAILWFVFSWYFDKFFGEKDQTDLKVYKNSKLLAAAFIVVFAVTESFVSWDMVMSLDPHWYSTLFGWYNFASYGCAAWAMTILIVIYLKSNGYLSVVNENHIHDLGKLLFGFSIFWTYLWFSQFMLQWYGNIPEDTNFWVKRFNTPYFKFTVFFALIINFVFPLLFLIKRSAKRSFRMIGFGAALLIVGHYVDFFNYTFFEPVVCEAKAEGHGDHHAVSNTDNTVLYAEAAEHGKEHAATDASAHKEDAHAAHGEAAHGGGHGHGELVHCATIGIGEILVFIGFLGLFLYMMFNRLSKRNLIIEKDPYLKENIKLEVTWA